MIRRPGAILTLLTGLNLLNYLDRMVVSAVLPKVQEELHLSNFQGGLLATIFLVGYFVTSPLFGALGDRLPRKGLIAAGVVVWSLATIASGMAVGVLSLLLARALVGIGEASYATLAPTIIDDVTPANRKGRALAIFYMATPIGAALGYLVGGFVESHWGWRSAFFVAGVPGVLLALVCLLIEEPKRKLATESDGFGTDEARVVALKGIARNVGKLAKVPAYRKAVLGYCAYTAAIGAFSYWAPKFLYVRYGLPLAAANFKFGIITVVAGALGTVLGGRWADRVANAGGPPKPGPEGYREQGYRDETPEAMAERERAEAHVRVGRLIKICATGSAVGAPIAAACFLSPTANVFFALVFLAIFFLFLNTSPINAVILQAVPNELRASAMALSIFSIHVFGDLWSPPLVGLLADNLPIQLAMMTLPVAIALSAVVWWPRGGTAAEPAR
jgi:MFS family permease